MPFSYTSLSLLLRVSNFQLTNNSKIALGTLILLSGVLCLSWRLNTDPTTRPPVAQNPLTPGMGFVDDSDDSDVENGTAAVKPDVEEDVVDSNKKIFFAPNQRRKRSHTTNRRTSTTRNNDLLAVTQLRRKGITESEEIWEELEDDTVDELSTSFKSRRHSTMSTSAKHTPQATTDSIPDESSLLLGRSNTGRSYRDKKERRSAPALEGGKKAVESQEAIEGWWKLWWWRGRKNRKHAGDDRINENGDRGP